MRYFKSIFLGMTFLFAVGTVFIFTGCDAGSGCDQSCSGGFFCPTTREGCQCVARQKGCSGSSFNERTGRCKLSSCDSCTLLVGSCREPSSFPNQELLSEYTTVFPLEGGCDIFAGEYSELECEEMAYERQCESMEAVSSDDDSELKECWFYDCKECSVDFPFYEEEIAELEYEGGK